nr:MAG TPA: toxin III family protein [Caudoviricetes sp.]
MSSPKPSPLRRLIFTYCYVFFLDTRNNTCYDNHTTKEVTR